MCTSALLSNFSSFLMREADAVTLGIFFTNSSASDGAYEPRERAPAHPLSYFTIRKKKVDGWSRVGSNYLMMRHAATVAAAATAAIFDGFQFRSAHILQNSVKLQNKTEIVRLLVLFQARRHNWFFALVFRAWFCKKKKNARIDIPGSRWYSRPVHHNRGTSFVGLETYCVGHRRPPAVERCQSCQ